MSAKITIKQIKKQPNDIQIVYLQAVLCPNGEIISGGIPVGHYKKSKQFVHEDCTGE